MFRWDRAVPPFAVLAASLACSGAGGEDWPAETTWTCAGGDQKTLQGITRTSTTKDLIAIEASGSCQLTLVDCDLTADFPLKAAGNAKVLVRGGRLHGNVQAVQAWGNAVITLEGVRLEGEQATSGKGRILQR